MNHKIKDSVNNNSVKSSVGDPVEGTSKGVKSKENDGTSEDTGKRSTDTTLGFQGRTREGTGSWVGGKEDTNQVVNTNGNELLVRNDFIVVDTAKGFGNGNMFKQKNNGTNGQFGSKEVDNMAVNNRNANISKTRRNGFNKRNKRLFSVVLVVTVGDGSKTTMTIPLRRTER